MRAARPASRARPARRAPATARRGRDRPRPGLRRASLQGRRDRPARRGSRRSGHRPGSGARRAAAPAPSARSVAGVPKPSSSSGIGGEISAGPACRTEAITTKRSAAAATIFSRVCAPPPPLTSQPLRVDLVGAVDRDVEPLERRRRPRRQGRARAPACSVAARSRRSAAVESALGERGQQVGDRRPGAEADRMPSWTRAAAASAAACFSSSAVIMGRAGNVPQSQDHLAASN